MTFMRRILYTALGLLRDNTKIAVLLTTALFQPAGTASAASTQKWTAGWDFFSEPLDFTHSDITWSVNATAKKLTVTFHLVEATPNKLYQVGVHIFCTTFPATFGQFAAFTIGGTCDTITRQGVTKAVAAVELGVVTTDIDGNGSFSVVVGPIAPGTYKLEFTTRNGAGCNLTGGGGSGGCGLDFQSPGPTFGTATTVTIP